MAIVGVSLKSSSTAPPSAKHADYIARIGGYERRGGLELVEHGNMPEFAAEDPRAFWLAADLYERANGRTYTELQLSLPRELGLFDHQELAREAVREFMGERFAYTMAIHCPKASDGLDQPHIHLMFSERVIDQRTRELAAEEFFRRNGAKKDRDWNQKTMPETIRARWCEMMNRALEHDGQSVRVDPRSYLAQGRQDLADLREPKGVRGREEQIAELRAMRAEVHETAAVIAELEQADRKQIAALDRQCEAASVEHEQKAKEAVSQTDPAGARLEQLDRWFPDLQSKHESEVEWWIKQKVWSLEDILKREPRSALDIFQADAGNPTRERLLDGQAKLRALGDQLLRVEREIRKRNGFWEKAKAMVPWTEISRLQRERGELIGQQEQAAAQVRSAEARYTQLQPAYELRAQHEGFELGQQKELAGEQRALLLAGQYEVHRRASQRSQELRREMGWGWSQKRDSGPGFGR